MDAGLAMISGRIWDVGSRNNRHNQVSTSLVLLADFLNLFKAPPHGGYIQENERKAPINAQML
jgi:hypothetical protein